MEQNAKPALSHSLPVIVDGERRCFGGTQMLLPKESIRDTGCGLISSANLLSYLTRFHGLRDGLFDRFSRLDSIPLADFNRACMHICRGFLRPLPHVGMTGTAVAAGLNREFRRRGIPYRARWCFRGDKLWERMAAMLRDDLPVILAIGPNLPRFWRRKKLILYRLDLDGEYTPAAKTNAHFVTVTAMDGDWLTVSSWGRRFYISRTEYADYAKRYSGSWFCNLVLLEKKE